MGVLLGAIADDFTGATDLCNTLVRRGMRTVQLIDVPRRGTAMPDAEALVVALKSRTIPAAEAVDEKPRGTRLAAAGRARGRSCSNTARPSIRPTPAISARSPRRCWTRSAPISPCSARPSRGRPHDLQGLSLRRRRVAVGIGDARPPADADARSLSGAGAAAAEQGQGRAGPARDRRPGRRPRSPPPSPRCAEGFATRSSMRSPTTISKRSARRRRISR